ncbi:MAG: aromatic amino acid ammonia-lyase [Bacteroidota bacterium]|nr:aromatic amino acid ammonia-lyase [Candidatus Kapabacteria bacterium]MDW8219838.1 aromatic amino acid ammonia-lyase [Bacteroidota bacterium]
MKAQCINLSPNCWLSCEDIAAIALGCVRVEFGDYAYSAMLRSQQVLERSIECGEPVYGVTTGFGALVQYAVQKHEMYTQGCGLVAHLSAGYGDNIEAAVVRAAMAARLRTFALGMSGVRREVVQFYVELLERNIIAAVPSVGSLGASGDLIPLAHIARVMIGEGEVLSESGTQPAREVLQKYGISPCVLTSRDALALVNGTSFSTAYLALAVVRCASLLYVAEELSAWILALLRCRKHSLHPRLHTAKGHRGQQDSALNMLGILVSYSNGSHALESPQEMWRHAVEHLPASEDRPLQEVYSLRCVPQILGAARDVLYETKRVCEQELNGADDNPLVCSDTGDILHGGNFMTQHIGFAADNLNSAITQVANLAERQIEVLIQPAINGGVPLLLSPTPGKCSGMAGVQLTATAVLAEMRAHRQQYASSSLPTNAGNQDIVPLGFQAARECYHQTERLAAILACVGMCAAQYAALVESKFPVPTWLQDFQPLSTDRPLRKEIAGYAHALLQASEHSIRQQYVS